MTLRGLLWMGEGRAPPPVLQSPARSMLWVMGSVLQQGTGLCVYMRAGNVHVLVCVYGDAQDVCECGVCDV